jgi:hypothetical protein
MEVFGEIIATGINKLPSFVSSVPALEWEPNQGNKQSCPESETLDFRNNNNSETTSRFFKPFVKVI